MTLKKSSRDPFASLFWNSVKRSCFVPITMFAIYLVYAVVNTISMLNDPASLFTYTNGNGVSVRTGFFMDFMYIYIFPTVLLIIGGVLAAVILFFFAQSKKRSNVIFSLGLSRRKIFFAKYLGGVLPLAAVLIVATLLELLSNLICGCWIGWPTIHLALWTVVTALAVYALVFTSTAVAMVFSGNIIEAGIFNIIFGAFPYLFVEFFVNMRAVFTYGAVLGYSGDWNYSLPFISLMNFGMDSKYYVPEIGVSLNDIYIGLQEITIYTWSGTITAFVLIVILLTVTVFALPKRRNEISGTFGRARRLTEICGVMTAIYAATYASNVALKNKESKTVIFFLMLAAFVIVYLIFKLIFSNNRKKAMARSAKRVVACIASFAVVTGVFATGLFGYSSYVPNAEDINHIDICVELTNPYAAVTDYESNEHSEIFGYAKMISNDSYYGYAIPSYNFYEEWMDDTGTDYPSVSVQDKEGIKSIVEIHKALVKDGKLKANADNACGYGFSIVYTLHGGKTVERYYSTASLENAIKLLGLSDLKEVKREIRNYLLYRYNHSNYGSYAGFCIFSKTLKSCKFVDDDTNEFDEAVLTDLENLTAEQIFFHKPEDELGVILFSTDSFVEKYLKLNEEEYVTADGEIYDDDTGRLIGNAGERMKNLITSSELSLSTAEGNCIVVTKYMKNTIKYLTDNNLMQYFKSDITADDVKQIKIASRAESVGRNTSEMLPFFAAAYACVNEMEQHKQFREMENHQFITHLSPITDKATIQIVLDNALLYGYNSNSDRVAEVTFNDGSIATYALSAEACEKLNIK